MHKTATVFPRSCPPVSPAADSCRHTGVLRGQAHDGCTPFPFQPSLTALVQGPRQIQEWFCALVYTQQSTRLALQPWPLGVWLDHGWGGEEEETGPLAMGFQPPRLAGCARPPSDLDYCPHHLLPHPNGEGGQRDRERRQGIRDRSGRGNRGGPGLHAMVATVSCYRAGTFVCPPLQQAPRGPPPGAPSPSQSHKPHVHL